jgi:acetyl-CoA C-acetyltransferase
MAFHAIKAGEGDAFISAGVEMVSRFIKGNSDSLPETSNPSFAEAQEQSAKLAEGGVGEWHDPRQDNRIPDVYIAMGQTAENVAGLENVTREEQDEFGVRSQNLAEVALKNGFWEREITPVTLPDGTIVAKDDGPRPGVTMEGVAGLKPVFRPDGTVTAGNSSPLNDGAAALLLADKEGARAAGRAPLARIVSRGVAGVEPQLFGIGPVRAAEQALQRAGLDWDDIDVVELNEAFAAQSLACLAEWRGLDPAKVNPQGGAIAIGHPLGASGARILGSLAWQLHRRGGGRGLAAICIGVGQGLAVVLEA